MSVSPETEKIVCDCNVWSWNLNSSRYHPEYRYFPVTLAKEQDSLTLTVVGRQPPLCKRVPANWNTNCLVRDEEGQRQERKRSRGVSDEVSWLSFFPLILRMNVVKVKAISLHCWASSGKDSSRRLQLWLIWVCEKWVPMQNSLIICIHHN